MTLERTKNKSILILCLVLVIVFAISSLAFAGKAKGKFYPPDQVGPYSIGHTTVQLTDTSRNLDGSTPATSEGTFSASGHLVSDDGKDNRSRILIHGTTPLYNENPDGLEYPGTAGPSRTNSRGEHLFKSCFG